MRTVWVLGDQLNRRIGALASSRPSDCRVLLIESTAMLEGRRYHRQRLHLVVAAMRRFGAELRDEGFAVDVRRAGSLSAGLAEHRAEYRPSEVVATEPNNPAVLRLAARNGVQLVRSDQFLCHREDFAQWAAGRRRLRLEDFYRWQRRRLGYLMEGDDPVGGRWNYDRENREPPPGDAVWPEPLRDELDDLDREVIAALPDAAVGADPQGWWATSRTGALARLDHFVTDVLPGFGPYEDAMTVRSWHLAHSLLSPYLNLGLLLPGEVCDRVAAAFDAGGVAINSAEGFIRQVIGWREFVWGISWLWPEQLHANVFGHTLPVPPAWTGVSRTGMRCVQIALDGLEDRGWVHHIQRLMVLSNIANLAGVAPDAVREWMRERYVDGGDWVMGPNVMGMGLWSDGGRMATKPYVSGGAYIDRMSDYCSDCRFDPRSRTGEGACPFTTLYWDFLDRHRDILGGNHRMARQYATLDRLGDLAEIRIRADVVKWAIGDGSL